MEDRQGAVTPRAPPFPRTIVHGPGDSRLRSAPARGMGSGRGGNAAGVESPDSPMTLSSMTGFARAAGALGAWRWTVEIKSVNAKGSTCGCACPPGFDRIEPEARARLGKALARGTVLRHISPRARGRRRHGADRRRPARRSRRRRARRRPQRFGLAPPTLDGLLAVRGVVEAVEAEDDEAARPRPPRRCWRRSTRRSPRWSAARRAEGEALREVLSERLDAIAALTAGRRRQSRAQARGGARAARRLDRGADRSRRAASTRRGCTRRRCCSPPRPTSARSSIGCTTHVAAARALLAEGGPVGRRLDFLAQEFGREANTLCAKSNDVTLTAQGLELRAQIEQLREQVQNIE